MCPGFGTGFHSRYHSTPEEFKRCLADNAREELSRIGRENVEDFEREWHHLASTGGFDAEIIQ